MEKTTRSTVAVAMAAAFILIIFITDEVFAAENIGKIPYCAEGQIGKFEGGEWLCSDDEDTMADLDCEPDQIAKYSDGQWVCADERTDSAANSAMSTPIIWSGGCSTVGLLRYCADQEEFNTAQEHLLVASDGTFKILTPGFYRISAFAQSRAGIDGKVIVQLYVYDESSSVTVPYESKSYSNNQVIMQHVDVTLPLDVCYTFDVRYSVTNPNYSSVNYRAWSASGTRSRIQVMYLGPLPSSPAF